MTALEKNRRNPDKRDADLGFRIRKRRQDMRLSLKTVSAQIGISSQQLRKYELGRNRISVQRLEQIAEILGATASDFMEKNIPSNSNLSVDLDKEAERLWMSINNVQHKTTILNLMKIATDNAASVKKA